MDCCYGCGNVGVYPFISKQSPHYGKLRCSKKYRSCPLQREMSAIANLGRKHSNETKQKIGQKSRGRVSAFKGLTAEDDSRILAGKNHPMFGRKLSVSTKEQISKSKSGIALTEVHRRAISESLSGNKNPRFGRSWSEAQKTKWKQTIEKNGSLLGDKNPNWNPSLDREGLKVYRSAVMRLSSKNAKLGGMITSDMNRQRITGGVELDHIVPISVCFSENISIEACASTINLQVIPWKENMAKRNAHYPLELLEELKGKSDGRDASTSKRMG